MSAVKILHKFLYSLSKQDLADFHQSVQYNYDELQTKLENNEPVNWVFITYNWYMTESLLEKYANLQDDSVWTLLCLNSNMSEVFFEKYIHKVNWSHLYSHMSETFLEKHIEKIDWLSTFHNSKLLNRFFKKHSDVVDWDLLRENLTGCDLDFVNENAPSKNIIRLY